MNKENLSLVIALSITGFLIFLCAIVYSFVGPIDPTINTTQVVTDSNTVDDSQTISNDTCGEYAQKAADLNTKAISDYNSVQYFHYSKSSDICYFVLHYQMQNSYLGNQYTSQVYDLDAQISREIISYPNAVVFTPEASCIVPDYSGYSVSCKYFGLTSYTDNGTKFMVQKFGYTDAPTMSYSDYKDLVQKSMNN